ncbi:MAG: HEAT repeat domain-containing protein [Candidatus Sumerlaeota bacterium]|nr:HEAT repeat domain-containing protein [Candidatus Sumerlaeota bacterium]
MIRMYPWSNFLVFVIIVLFYLSASPPTVQASADPQEATSSPLARAQRLLELGDAGNAEVIAAAALRENPDDLSLHEFLARLYLTNPRWESEIESIHVPKTRGSMSSDNTVSIESVDAVPKHKQFDVNVPRGRAHLRALAMLGNGGYQLLANSLLKDTNTRVRTEAAMALAQSGNPESAGALIAALDNETGISERSLIINALGRTGSEEAYRYLYNKLTAIPPDTQQRDGLALFTALWELPNPMPMEELQAQILRGTPFTQKLAVKGMLSVKDADGAGTFLKLFFSPQPFPKDAWGAVNIKSLTDDHIKMIEQALQSADNKIVTRALMLCGRRSLVVPALEPALTALMVPPDWERVRMIMSLIGVPTLRTSMDKYAEMMFAPDTPKDAQETLANAIAETTMSLRPRFIEILTEKSGSDDATSLAKLIRLAPKVLNKWNNAQANRIILDAFSRVAKSDTKAADTLFPQIRDLKLSEYDMHIFIEWLTNDQPESARYNAAEQLVVDAAGSDKSPQEISTWAYNALADQNSRRRTTALKIIYMAIRQKPMTDEDNNKIAALQKRLWDEKRKRNETGTPTNDIQKELGLCRSILDLGQQQQRPRNWFLK